MRKVLFKRWIAQQWQYPNGEITNTRFPVGTSNASDVKQVPGTGCYDAEFKNAGFFHGWGNEVHEDDKGYVMETFAIVENPNGEIEHIVPKNVQFIEPVKDDLRLRFNPKAFNDFINRPIKTFNPDNFIVHRIFVNKAPVDFVGDGISFSDVCRVAFGEDGNYDVESLSCHYSHDSEKEGVVRTAGIMRLGDKLPVIEGMTFDFNYTVAGLETIAKNQTEQP